MYPAVRCAHYALSVLNFKGRLNIRWSLPAKVTRTVRPAADPACSENAYSLAGPFWANTGIATDAWFYNQGTASRAGLTVAATQSEVRSKCSTLNDQRGRPSEVTICKTIVTHCNQRVTRRDGHENPVGEPDPARAASADR